MAEREGPLAEVELELTRDDYVAAVFSKADERMPKRWQWLLLGALLGLALLLMGAVSLLTGGLEWLDEAPLVRPLIYAIGVVLGLMVVVLGLVAALRAWVRRMPRDDGAVLGWHRVALTEDGVHIETRAGRSFVAWSGVFEIHDRGEHILLFIDRGAAHVVPKRAFSSTGEAQRFVQIARERSDRSPTA